MGEGLFHQVDVVPVDRPGIADAQGLEERVRGHHLAQRAGDRVHARVRQWPEGRQAAEAIAQALAGLHVGRVEPQAGQALRQLGHRRGVGAAVVVQDDHDPAARVAEVVERLVGHAPGEGAVTDHGDHLAVPSLTPQGEGVGHAVGVGEGGGGVAVLDPVVLGLGPVGVARHPARLLERLEAEAAPGQQLVHVGLVAGVPQEDVAGRLEDAVQGQGQFDGAEVRSQVAAGGGHRLDDEGADLVGQLAQLLLAEGLDVGRRLDALKDHGVWHHATPPGPVLGLRSVRRQRDQGPRRTRPRPGAAGHGRGRRSARPSRPPAPPPPSRCSRRR